MVALNRLYHFLGGVYFAIILISALAGTVILGTVLESKTESHLYAAAYTYHHPFFGLLLWLFFINILFSALRRWPFQKKHIPFLITHVGLLMIIGGTILKNKYGLQGHLMLLEGSGSQRVILPYSEAIYLEKRQSQTLQSISRTYPLKTSLADGVSWTLRQRSPHIQERLQTWIKGQFAFFPNLPPIPLQEWTPSQPLTSQGITRLYHDLDAPSWEVMAIRTSHLQEAIEQAYLSGTQVKIKSRETQSQNICTIPLIELTRQGIQQFGCHIKSKIDLSYSPLQGFDHPNLTFGFDRLSYLEEVQVPLMGESSLYNIVKIPALQPVSRFEIDLIRKPLLLLIENEQGIPYLFAFDQYGRVHSQSFDQASLNTLVVYDQGFGGYAAYVHLPFPSFPCGRIEKEQADFKQLGDQLEKALDYPGRLAPPLQLLKQACDLAGCNFKQTFMQFLWQWHQSQASLLTMHKDENTKSVLNHIDWHRISHADRKACEWMIKLSQQLESSQENGEDLLALLKRNRWPFIKQIEELQIQGQLQDLWSILAQQLFAIAPQLPELTEKNEANPAQLLSAYMLAFGIQYHQLQTPKTDSEEHFEHLLASSESANSLSHALGIDLEVPLTLRHLPETPVTRWEDNRPGILLVLKRGQQQQQVSLAYDAQASGLKWPIFNGSYLIRFQPHVVEIPYRLRLRQARQINYASSSQPYSYESDVLILGPSQPPIEKTLSMNNVYETWDGYRFYLAGMTTTEEGIKQVQIVVNRDPAKYILTYPGAMITFFGIILLFWMRPYQWMQRKKIM